MKLVNQIRNTTIITLVFPILLLLLPIRHVSSQCSPSQWMCDNQVTCIDGDEKCDGHKDCPDGSDETAINCFNATTCPEYSFQCSYGACITGRRKCNGIPDCADKSDEILCMESVALGKCSNNDEVQCSNARQCIDSSDICDGHANCSDGSDETLELCGREECPTGFRCAYGACVSGYALCNGTRECHDGSDEAWELCGYTRKFSKSTTTTTTTTTTVKPVMTSRFNMVPEDGLPCKVPEGLVRVALSYITSDEALLPGTLVEDDVTIMAKCKNKDDKGVDLYCLNGTWKGVFPTCSVHCDRSKLKGISTTYVCHRNGIQHETLCTPSVLTNTNITFYCSTGYRRTLARAQELHCQEDGSFNDNRTACDQHCGQLTPAVRSLTRNGFPIKPSLAPWHVSIYRNDDGEQTHICGGSIISPRLIISAAHCFWNRTVPTSPDLYRIIAGKLTKRYAMDKSEGAPQEIAVEKIFISEKYNDIRSHYYADIAILKLKAPLIYNENVTAICMHTPEGDVKDYVKSYLPGSITGYGRSGVLERLSMSTVSNEECQRLRDGSSLAGDKFCLRNENVNSTLCQGDSGGGFVEKYNDAFYLLGIVSYTPVTRHECVTAEFVGMSNVRYMRKDLYDEWQREIARDKELF